MLFLRFPCIFTSFLPLIYFCCSRSRLSNNVNAVRLIVSKEGFKGFRHAAFTLGYEAEISKSNINANLVPPGALVRFVQKGIQYLELEANLTSDDLDVDEEFHFLQPLDLLTKNVNELHKIIKEKKESLKREKKESLKREKKESLKREKKAKVDEVAEPEGSRHKNEHSKERENENEPKEKEPKIEKIVKVDDRERSKDKEKPQEDPVQTMKNENVVDVKHKEAIEVAEPMEICTNSASLTVEIPDSDVLVLEGHDSEVFACAWNPAGSLLASVSADSTARIWTIGDATNNTNMQNETPGALVLKHFEDWTNENEHKDVTTLDWNVEGTLLATGSCDGQARIWNRDGELVSSLIKHKGWIFSLKWNKKGDYLLSGSVDKSAAVWDVKTGNCRQFHYHTAPILDVDWKNNVVFATCSADTMIHACKVGGCQPLKTFAGHQAEVNAIKWDPTGSLLASCSDDGTAKIWSMKEDKCVHDFKDHAKEVYTIRWSPTGPNTDNPNLNLLLASASFDSTIKLWDTEAGRLICSLNGHRGPVYSIAFSPNGEYLASGSLDKSVNVWSLKEAKIVKTYKGNCGVFEVCWNKEGNRLAACFANNAVFDNNLVCVVDFRF